MHQRTKCCNTNQEMEPELAAVVSKLGPERLEGISLGKGAEQKNVC